MSVPESMDCLAPDHCRSPLGCHHAGECAVRAADRWESWWLALSECRKRGIADPFSAQGTERR